MEGAKDQTRHRDRVAALSGLYCRSGKIEVIEESSCAAPPVLLLQIAIMD
jgi:hypothetical protein